MRFALLLFLSSLPFVVDSAAICVTGYTLVNNKCLKLVTTPSSHSAAEATCATSGGTLTTARNAIENRALATFVGTSISQVWLGLYCVGNDPTKCFWDDASGSTNSYNSFARSFPYVELGNCVYYLTTGSLAGQWFANSCTFNYNGFCYTPSRSTSYGTLDFSDAQQACEHLGTNSNLASIHSENEMRFIKSIHQGAYAADEIIIGGVGFAVNSFVWTDASPWDYNNIPTSSSRGCVHMNVNAPTSGIWTVQNCETPGRFLCKRPAGTAAPVTVTPSPTNVPTCNTAILMTPGIFTSPGFPGAYSNNLYCTYSLATIGDNRIYLSFSAFATEAGHDIVSVYDGSSTASPLLRTLSGSLSVPLSLTSTGNQMFVAFRTDGSVVASGFSAKFLSII